MGLPAKGYPVSREKSVHSGFQLGIRGFHRLSLDLDCLQNRRIQSYLELPDHKVKVKIDNYKGRVFDSFCERQGKTTTNGNESFVGGVAFVTGAGGDIGRATALAFAY